MPFWKKKVEPEPEPEIAAAPPPAAAVPASPTSPAQSNGTPGTQGGADDEESPFFGKKIDMSAFELCQTLGKGSFGHVMLVRKTDSGELLAMKVLQKRNLMKRQQVEHTRAERSIMERIRGVPFLVHVRYAFQTVDKLFMVMDFMQGGELFFHLKKLGRFNARAVQFYASQMSLALEHLHSIDVIYRDLKPENVLLGADGYLCLTDFGLSKEGIEGETEGANSFCGTPEYVAPEILKEGSKHGKGVDWWAMGTLLYEMLHGLPPFYSQNTAGNEMMRS